MDIEWHPDKAKSNFEKHGIRFSDAEAVLFDEHGLTLEDERSDGEQRWVTIGMSSTGRILLVVYTYRNQNVIRLISARTATKQERKNYEN